MKSVVDFLVLEPCSSAVALRQYLAKALPWTRELAVAGHDGALTVHLRTSRPDLALAGGVEFGRLQDILVGVEPMVATHAQR